MASAMRKMAVYLGLVEDERYDDYGNYGEYDDAGLTDGYGRRPDGSAQAEDSDRHDRYDGARRPVAAVRDGQEGIGEGRSLPGGPGGGAVVTPMPDRRGSGATVMAPTPSAPPAQPSDLTSITTIHPRTYNEAKAIGERFRTGTPVIMNLTEMDDSDAKRLVDFAAGLVFGLRGTIERVTAKVFLLSPANVTVTAEDKARMAESGFFNQS